MHTPIHILPAYNLLSSCSPTKGSSREEAIPKAEMYNMTAKNS